MLLVLLGFRLAASYANLSLGCQPYGCQSITALRPSTTPSALTADVRRLHTPSRTLLMKKTLPYVAAALLVLSVATSAQTTTTPQGEEFVFRFQPPDGTRVRLTYTMQRNRLIEGQPATKDESETQTEGVFRRVGETFEYSPKTVAASMRRNGTPVNDPISGLLSKIQATYVVSAGGEAISIKGFGEIEAIIKSMMPAPLAAALAPMLNEATLVGQQKAEWNARYAEFADGKFRIGDVIDVEAPQQLPNGTTITYTIRTKFPGWEPCAAGKCIRLEQVYESDAEELARMAQGVATRVAEAVSIAPPTSQSPKPAARITGSLSRLIDPKTMLIYSEQVKRTISMQLQVPGKGAVPTVQEESRTYSYAYE